jgi:hypothetical protein
LFFRETSKPRIDNAMRCVSFGLCALQLAVFTGCRLPPQRAGTSFYPIGIYSVPSTNDLASLKQAGFNLVVGRAERAYLDAARDAGLKVLAAPGTSAGPGFNPAKARDIAGQFDRHPALWAWYVVDEPDMDGIPPAQVSEACRSLKAAGARKPTALVLYQGYEALHYGNLADITLIDRYPIPWLPLANFGQHVTMTRLALGRHKPLVAVIQAFDWASCPELLPGRKNFRAPTHEEIRCMTYEALARGANGLLYYAYDSGRWKLREHPETWEALRSVVREVNRRLPLFQGRPQWWAKHHKFSDPEHGFNAALESSVTSALLRVNEGNARVPAGDYIVAVNNTENRLEYSFALPRALSSDSQPSTLNHQPSLDRGLWSIPVLEESRSLVPQNGRLTDAFLPYAVHVYGPI